MPEPYASKQRKLLETEGVAVDVARIDMSAYGWSPAKARMGKPKTAKRVKHH